MKFWGGFEILLPSSTAVCSGLDSFVPFIEELHVLQHVTDLGSERVIVNRYLGFELELCFSISTLVDVTIFTGSSGMKSCS